MRHSPSSSGLSQGNVGKGRDKGYIYSAIPCLGSDVRVKRGRLREQQDKTYERMSV